MALGLLLGVIGLGLRGVGHGIHAYENAQMRQDLHWSDELNGYWYSDRKHCMYDARTGRKFVFDRCRMIRGEYLRKAYIGSGARDEDKIVVDLKTHRIIRNISAEERRFNKFHGRKEKAKVEIKELNEWLKNPSKHIPFTQQGVDDIDSDHKRKDWDFYTKWHKEKFKEDFAFNSKNHYYEWLEELESK